MTSDPPADLAQALRRPGYLLTAWPWRALAYLISTVPVAGPLSLGLLVIAAPLFAFVSSVRRDDRPIDAPMVACLSIVGLTLVALAPIVSAPVAALERWRLRLVDTRPVYGRPWRALASRYVSAAAWREVAYLFWLGGVVALAYWLLALLVFIDLVLVTSPWLAGSDNQIVLVWTTVDTPRQAIPYAIVAVLLLPVLWYLTGVLAAGQVAVARWLLGWTPDPAQLREVTRSRARLVDAYEAERRRIGRDVHDAAQPRLTSLTLQLGLARLDVPPDSPAAAPLASAHEQAKGLMVTLREIVHGLRPQALTDLGLVGAVREQAGQCAVPVTVTAGDLGPLPELIETTAYFVVSEALGNVARHAAATSAQVHLNRIGGLLVVEVVDDGRGGADPIRGTGLVGLADRVAAVSGRVLLASPPGGPTRVRVELPCPR